MPESGPPDDTRAPERPRRVLVPLDGSWVAEKALVWAETLARSTGARLVLFRVELPVRTSVFMAPLMGQPSEAHGTASDLAEEYMVGLGSRLNEEGIQADVEVVHSGKLLEEVTRQARAEIADAIGEAIVARCGEDDIDLLILASHGMTSDYTARWGSVCQAVMSKANKPVLLVPVS